MADELDGLDEAENSATKVSGNSRWLLVLLLSIGLALLGAAASFYFLKNSDKTISPISTEKTVQKTTGKPLFYQVRPDFVVNLEKERPVRFLQIQVQIMTYNPSVITACENYEPLIKDSMLAIFAQKKASELSTEQGKDRLRQDVLAVVQKIIQQESGLTGIENILFTNFLMQ